ncbi:MAG TPA: hypothetical protein VGI74_03965 [Streptosporangiaceae bacterium]|jgi:hypothetical protein
MTPESAADIVAAGGKGADRALSYLVADAFLRRPEETAATVAWAGENLSYHPVPSKPNRQHALDRTLLAGTMGVTYFLLAQDALGTFLRSQAPPKVGESRCYVVPHWNGGEPIAVGYEDPCQDAHMCAVVQLVDAGRRIAEQARDPASVYARYAPVWELEDTIRQTMQVVSHARNTQRPFDDHPLGPESIRRAGTMFMRNVMHHLLLTAQSLPPGTPVADIQQAVISQIRAAEIASQYPRETQRVYMGLPGSEYAGIRARRGITPHMVTDSGGNARIAGFEKSPPNPSMCPGQDAHEIPDWLSNDYTPAFVSPIGMLALWEVAISPYTLFRDSPGGQQAGSEPAGSGADRIAQMSGMLER